MTQNQMILDHLRRHGPLTALDSLRLYGVLRLAARVWELREQGHDIRAGEVTLANGKSIAQYRLEEAGQIEMAL